MKFDLQKAFPYPVLRPYSDDYVDCDIQSTPDFSFIGENKKVHVEISIAISSDDILKLVEGNRAEYVSIISCRNTYFREVIRSSESFLESVIDSGLIKGEVEVNSFVVAKDKISGIVLEDLNVEFGDKALDVRPGQLLAMDEPKFFYFDRESFKPITSVFSLVTDHNCSDSEWHIFLDCEIAQIRVSSNSKEIIDRARNVREHQAVLLNSLYFNALVEAVRVLSLDDGQYRERKWADVLTKAIHNEENISLDDEPYRVAQELLKGPLSQMNQYVFKGDDS